MAVSLCKWLYATGLLLFICFDGNSSGLSIGLHPLYVSVTEINYNAKDRTVEISCKIFTNDLEATLEKLVHGKVDLSDQKDKPTTDKFIADYIQKHLQLKLDGRTVNLQFIGSEKETDATWSYFQVNNITAVKKIDIMNSILYDSFGQEINIMHVMVGGNRKSTKLSNPETNASFEF
jgi:hypothetical protein